MPDTRPPAPSERAYPFNDNRTFVALENVLQARVDELCRERDFLREIVAHLSTAIEGRGDA